MNGLALHRPASSRVLHFINQDQAGAFVYAFAQVKKRLHKSPHHRNRIGFRRGILLRL